MTMGTHICKGQYQRGGRPHKTPTPGATEPQQTAPARISQGGRMYRERIEALADRRYNMRHLEAYMRLDEFRAAVLQAMRAIDREGIEQAEKLALSYGL
jgi:hypothetical protein